MRNQIRRSRGPRFRDELKRTYYCEGDRRRKAATLTVIRYSDGREYRNIRYHNGHTKDSLYLELGHYMRQLLLVGPEFE